jgi:DNA polymerase
VSLLDTSPFASFAALEAEALACTRCRLAETRTQVVFGVGDPQADLVFVGEGPGEQEDLQGEPFVGRAGKLLTNLIEGIGLTRADVYIANVVKCRPPGNRDPQADEIEACRPYLEAQMAFIRPGVVVTLGNFATKLLLDTKVGITKLRGQEFPYGGADGAPGVLIPTLHPSAVLRNGGVALAQARADFVLVKRALARVQGVAVQGVPVQGAPVQGAAAGDAGVGS